MMCARLAHAALTLTLGAMPLVAAADPARVESISPGEITALAGKEPLPHREDLLTLTVAGEVLVGDGTGVQAQAGLRFAEAIGVGGGLVAAASGATGFVRFEALGLAINHWALIVHADYRFDDHWIVGAALLVPLRRDSYLRASVASDLDEASLFGFGLEHDLW
jgi:hypothetical protein